MTGVQTCALPISCATIDEGIEILTGVPAGKKDRNGNFPNGSINYLAQEKLKKFSKMASHFEK